MDRMFHIINIILNNKECITVDSIANALNVSNKTIRNDLKKVEAYIQSKGLKLFKKPGSGISIEGEENKKLDLINSCKAKAAVIEPFSPEDRKNYILKRLFMSEESITIKELAIELYVSRVTIHKDLELVDEWLNNYNLQLLKKPNYGVEIVGEEDNWRKAASSLIAIGKENVELKELLYKDYTGRIDYKTLVKLKELINIDYKQLEKIVIDGEGKLKFRFSDEAFISLIMHIAISIKRLQQNKDINLSNDILMNLFNKEEYSIAKDMGHDIEQYFKVKLPETEIGYITLHLLGAKMQQNKLGEASLDITMDKDELSHIMAKEIIEKLEKMLSVDLYEDKQLVNGLILHLRPTVNRLKYGLTLRNPIIDEIKENYPEIYGAAWMTSSVFQKYLGVKISDEEIGYIALHFAAAVERQKKPLTALVVCTSGIGTSQLLALKLKKHFSEIEIKDIVSYVSISSKDLIGIDIIISTLAINVDKPTIIISPLLNQNDIKRLDEFINKIAGKRNKISDVLDEDFIFINAKHKDKSVLIKDICEKLNKEGYVKEGYLESIMDREIAASTEVGNGVAIPHGSPQLVNRSRICVIILDSPVKWNEEYVDIVFLICISEKDVRRFEQMFRYLYNKINDTVFIKELKCKNNKKSIKGMLEGIDYDN
jgi:transcriptional antiterminator